MYAIQMTDTRFWVCQPRSVPNPYHTTPNDHEAKLFPSKTAAKQFVKKHRIKGCEIVPAPQGVTA